MTDPASMAVSVDVPRCPGCDAPISAFGDCDRCEYFNLLNDPTRYHYCGRPSCYCRNLPGRAYMKPEVLAQFVETFQREHGKESR